jgi:cobalt-zinc-cadmium efflux system membrane fusion protein
MPRRFSGPGTGRNFTPFGAYGLGVLAVALCLATVFAVAHEGHDNEQAPAVATAPGLPRLVTASEAYELVAVLEGERLKIYLDRFEDNSPVADANITVTINDESTPAGTAGDGTYFVSSKKFGDRGLVELIFDIRAKEADDLLIGKLTLVGSIPGEGSSGSAWYRRAWSYLRHGAEDHFVLVAFTLLMGLAIGRVLGNRRVRALPILALLTLFPAMTVTDRPARAHEGHDHAEDASTAPPAGDTARRLPDGKVFVPKPTQRILDIRTVVAKTEMLHKAVVLVGRVIANPNRSGLVQSINGGRVVAPEQGLPRLGQAVTKGDVLGSVEPPMAMADRTTISERMGELEQLIAVAEAKLKRLRPMAERGVAPQGLVVETEAELDGLYRRREAVRDTRIAPEILRAPTDGVVAMTRVVAGQVIQAQDVLFQIVDPNSLWVEAYDYSDNDPATLTHATAAGPTNVAMKLGFQGWGRTLQQQATVLQFAISAPPLSIRVGQPVTVTAQRDETTSGVIVERDAIVRGGNGESIVWRHAGPEFFEPLRIRTEPFDATRVLVAAGIAEGDRIVVRGAELINQIH